MIQKKILSILFIAVLFVLIGFAFAKWYPKELPATNSVAENNVLDVSVSPDGTYIAKELVDAEGEFRNLTLLSRDTGESTTLINEDDESQIHSLVWSASSERLFFAVTRTKTDQSVLLYVDKAALDPNAVTEIVFSDPEAVLNGTIKIVGASGDTMYIENQDRIFSLDLSQGVNAQPILFEE